MAYHNFAFYYDLLNEDANYDALTDYLSTTLQQHGITQGIVVDLACGTGEVGLRMAQRGYEMICIDASSEMLGMLLEKAESRKVSPPLLLCQDLANLDLYGTIDAAISTFDSLNHLSPGVLQQTIAKTALFMEPHGLFIFDMNTPYKHRQVLADHTFIFQPQTQPSLTCEWNNQYLPEKDATQIDIAVFSEEDEELFSESFLEYSYSLETIQALLEQNHFEVLNVLDGDTFGPLQKQSERMLFTALRDAWRPTEQ